jgi:hypothetical protein
MRKPMMKDGKSFRPMFHRALRKRQRIPQSWHEKRDQTEQLKSMGRAQVDVLERGWLLKGQGWLEGADNSL